MRVLGKHFVKGLLHVLSESEPRYFVVFGVSATLAVLILDVLIISKVRYTEIDWSAYMLEVQTFLKGERNYDVMNPKEPWLPLVYPAGFVYVFSGLSLFTGWAGVPDSYSDPDAVLKAQWLFMVLHMLTVAVVALTWRAVAQDQHPMSKRYKMWPAALLLLLPLSMRIHSIFVLRMFNDCVAMLLVYCAVFLFVSRWWTSGCVVLSCAISVKMNVLLYVPAVALLLVLHLGAFWAIVHMSLIFLVQMIIAAPFLATYPLEYMHGAFNFGRTFLHQWSVNFKFVPEAVFSSPMFAKMILVLHLSLLFFFALKWCQPYGGLWAMLHGSITGKRQQVPAVDILIWLYTTNFIGVLCAKSLHFQFYTWYFHSLPALVAVTPFPWPIGCGLLRSLSCAGTPGIGKWVRPLQSPLGYCSQFILCWYVDLLSASCKTLVTRR